MDTKKKVKKSLPYSVAISLLNLVISLFGMIYLVRYLDEVDFGMLGLFLGLPFMLNIIVAMGFNKYITRFIPSVKEDKEVARKFWRIFFVRIFFLLITSAILVFLFPWFGPMFKMENHQIHFNFYQISLLATFGEIYTRVLMNARFLQKELLIMRVLYQSIRLAIIYWGISHQSDFLFFIMAFAGMDLFNVILATIIISIKIGPPKLRYILKSYKETKEEKEYRQISYVNEIGTSFLNTDIDRYIIGYFSTPTQVAIYVLATQILGKLGNFFPDKMLKPLSTPAFFAEFDNSAENVKKLNRMFQFIFNTNNMVGFMFLACFIPVGKDLITFFFHKPYTEEAFWPLIIFMVFMVLYSIPIGMVTQAIKKPQILLISKVSIIFNMGLGIPMAKFYGAAGMAAATAASFLIKNLIVYVLVRKHVDVQIPWNSVIRSIINSGLTIGLITVALPYIHTHVVIDAAITVILYFVIMKFNPILTTEQKNTFFSLIPKKIAPVAHFIF